MQNYENITPAKNIWFQFSPVTGEFQRNWEIIWKVFNQVKNGYLKVHMMKFNSEAMKNIKGSDNWKLDVQVIGISNGKNCSFSYNFHGK